MQDEPLTKECIRSLKQRNDGSLAAWVGRHARSCGDLVFVLENLGRLPASFDAGWLLDLLTHENENVRVQAVKNVGKLGAEAHLERLYRIACKDRSTIVKREAVSSIGRMRDAKAIPLLTAILADGDPKVVCQAVRGLLVFKGRQEVDRSLEALANHPNETVRAVIRKAYRPDTAERKPVQPHAQVYPFLRNVAVNGDVRKVLQTVPDESIHLTFTSPPYYNARDYSIYPSYEAYLKFLKKVFAQTYRVTKEGRFLIVNTSPVIIPRVSRSHASHRYPIPFDLHGVLTSVGWEFIDDIVWMKPEYSVKNRIGGFQQHRKPLAYKPNSVTEYLMVYRKRSDRLIDWNIRQYDAGTVEESRVRTEFETTNVWQILPKADRIHPAVFPEELCRRVIEYYSYKGDLVFDPFAGIGTLGRAARKLGRSFFLAEIDPHYFAGLRDAFRAENPLDEAGRYYTVRQFRRNCAL